jgi:hypothetical protein
MNKKGRDVPRRYFQDTNTTASHKLLSATLQHKPPLTAHRLPITDYRLPITGTTPA